MPARAYKRLLPSPQSEARRLRSTAGFSLVELLGLVVLVGILSLAAYLYVGNASRQAVLVTKSHNCIQLNRLLFMAQAGGVPIGPGKTVDTSSFPSAASAIASFNQGIYLGVAPYGYSIQMLPPVATPSSYQLTGSSTGPYFVSDNNPDTPP